MEIKELQTKLFGIYSKLDKLNDDLKEIELSASDASDTLKKIMDEIDILLDEDKNE